ncbi:hypothetical protein [Deinococcus sp.]|uniref:hypothetical protein n=1 Tax=Deinococcus sp. TaxID=47478 RepID=UPI003C7B28F1
MSSRELEAALPARRSSRPGTLPWLLAFQLRVSWRALASNRRTRLLLIVAAAALILGAASLAPRLWAARGSLGAVPHLGGFAVLGLGLFSALIFLLMFSAAIGATLEALYERGDLDLLLGAPLRPRLVLASRLLGVAVSAGSLYALLAVPVLVFAVAAGLWRLLGLVPWLLSLSVISASLGGLLTLGLVRLLGVRRARTAASIVGALSGAAFFLVSQLQNLRGRSTAPLIGTEQLTALQSALDGRGPLGDSSPLWYPARVLWLEPLPTLVMLVLAAGLLWLSVQLLEGAFLRGAQQAGMHGAAGRRVTRRAASGPLRLREGAAATLFKEWRLLARDPLLLSRILLQLVYLLPLGLVLLQNGSGVATLVGGGGVLVLGSLASSLALITTNAEEAPDLLLSAPVRLSRLRWLKLWAAVLPVLGLWLLLNLIGLRAPSFQLLLGALLSLWAILGGGLIVLWRPLEVRRADLFRRGGGGQRGDLLMTLSLLLMQGGLVAALFFLPQGSIFGGLGLALAIIAPLLSLTRRRTTGPG